MQKAAPCIDLDQCGRSLNWQIGWHWFVAGTIEVLELRKGEAYERLIQEKDKRIPVSILVEMEATVSIAISRYALSCGEVSHQRKAKERNP